MQTKFLNFTTYVVFRNLTNLKIQGLSKKLKPIYSKRLTLSSAVGFILYKLPMNRLIRNYVCKFQIQFRMGLPHSTF